ncbi:glycosyltransferase family 8 protein [Devosia sp. Root105]|uniref:glycosyltransferase family 8 protein n=1 Tax=Devosia sp. Root105 TaxID=1736423 RepID=UPI0006F27151|nr:glycosyltransferase family 8 protein [Devosia sp. Root105]KQU97359.1 hypothetical protein ASC68_11130 [Devosia sp. Root105]
MDEVHIAFAVDRGYFNQVAVTIASIVANAAAPDALRFYVLHADDESWVAEQMARWTVPHVQAVRVDNPFDPNRNVVSYISVAAMLRILLPLALPHLSRVIYLDADIVVLHDVAELWRADIGEAPMGAVVDLGVHLNAMRGDLHNNPLPREGVVALGLDPSKPQYVNSGLLVMNLDKLRQTDFVGKAREMDAARGRTLPYVDQDIINALMKGQMALLDPRWNVLAGVYTGNWLRRHHYATEPFRPAFALQKAEQWAIHYTGLEKPWNSAEAWRGGEEWWRYAANSGVQWQRPAAPARTFATTATEAWLDFREKLSVLRFRIQKRAG